MIALAVVASLCCTAAARANGRLATYPLVYRLTPATTEDPLSKYAVFFHTRGAFIGHDSIGTSIPGKIELEDTFDNHDGLGVLPPERAYCYVWSLAETRALKRKRVGDRVRLRFKLRGTPTERRTVTLRSAPRRVEPGAKPWYRRDGSVAQRLAWIGCG